MNKKALIGGALGLVFILAVMNIPVTSYAALNPVAGADIGLEVRAPANQLVFFDVVTTGTDGCAQTSFTIGSTWPDGTYTVYGAASGYGVSNQTTFGINVIPDPPTYSTPINYLLDISTDQQTYTQGDTVTITACLYEIAPGTPTTTPPPTTTTPPPTTTTPPPPAAVGGVIDSGYDIVRPMVVAVAVILLAAGALLLARRA